MNQNRWLGALVPLLSLAVYLPALQGGWIWDDKIVWSNGMVYRTDALATIWLRLWEFSGEVHYWPVTYTSFWLEDRLWGLSPTSAHVVNVTLHSINTALAWKLLVRMGLDDRAAAIGALLFAVHPVHAEPVAWIIARKDLLFGSVLPHCHPRMDAEQERTPQREKNRGLRRTDGAWDAFKNDSWRPPWSAAWCCTGGLAGLGCGASRYGSG